LNPSIDNFSGSFWGDGETRRNKGTWCCIVL